MTVVWTAAASDALNPVGATCPGFTTAQQEAIWRCVPSVAVEFDIKTAIVQKYRTRLLRGTQTFRRGGVARNARRRFCARSPLKYTIG
jgi:hypothetical protein